MFAKIAISFLAFIGVYSPPISQTALISSFEEKPQIRVGIGEIPIISLEDALLKATNNPFFEEIATSTEKTELDYTKQCVYFARQNSPFSPDKVNHAKEIPVLVFEPRKDYWSIYGEGCQYGFSGHNGIAKEYNLDEGWFMEIGRNLDGKGTIYERKVYFKGENKDKCLLGFFGYGN